MYLVVAGVCTLRSPPLLRDHCLGVAILARAPTIRCSCATRSASAFSLSTLCSSLVSCKPFQAHVSATACTVG